MYAQGALSSRRFRRNGDQLVDAVRAISVIAGDPDVVTHDHSAALFRLLGRGTGEPLPNSRLANMPATSHTAVNTQPDLLDGFIEPS